MREAVVTQMKRDSKVEGSDGSKHSLEFLLSEGVIASRLLNKRPGELGLDPELSEERQEAISSSVRQAIDSGALGEHSVGNDVRDLRAKDMPQFAISKSDTNLQQSKMFQDEMDFHIADEELRESSVGILDSETPSQFPGSTSKHSELDFNDFNSARADTTPPMAFSEQQIARVYGDVDEVEDMPPGSQEKSEYDGDAHNLGEAGKSDPQNLNLPNIENTLPLITKHHNAIDELPKRPPHPTPDFIVNITPPGHDIQENPRPDPQENQKKAQSFFLGVLEKLGILKQEPPVPRGYTRLRWQCVSCHPPPKVSM